MNRMQFETTTAEAGSPHVQISGRPHRYEVVVTLEWEVPMQPPSERPPGWVEATAGSIADPTFERPPQSGGDS